MYVLYTAGNKHYCNVKCESMSSQNANHFCLIICHACESVTVVLRIIHAHSFAIQLTILRYTTTLVHSTVQVKLLNETAINRTMLTHDTFFLVLL